SNARTVLLHLRQLDAGVWSDLPLLPLGGLMVGLLDSDEGKAKKLNRVLLRQLSMAKVITEHLSVEEAADKNMSTATCASLDP
ncbi:hypothetical protein U9M48_012466, partial [Paspalum notatum var. saurae]